MSRAESFLVLGIGTTKEEQAIRNAYREKLAAVNPEDDPEGFKRLRSAYEEACRYAKEEPEEGKRRDTTPSGLWLEKAVEIYGNIRTRQDVACWKALFEDDIFFSLEEEENCRLKLLGYLTEHFKLPTAVWKLFDRKLSIVRDAGALREKFPLNFVHYIVGRCERGEDLEFGQFEGEEDADYDLFLEYYDRCWQALQEKRLEEAETCVRSADAMGIRHPVMEISRANILVRQGRAEEAIALLEQEREKYPKDAMICYNFAELLWLAGEEADPGKAEERRRRAAALYEELKADNDAHYMANLRLTEWYYGQRQYRMAKKCAEKVLASGSDDAFLELLAGINARIEAELEARCREGDDWEPRLELCWCYLQDGKAARGLWLARRLGKRLPPEKAAEYRGLMAKLYVEQGEYEAAISMASEWQTALEEKLEKDQAAGGAEEKKDWERLRQARLIRMQCCHSLGFKEKAYFALAIQEGEGLLVGDGKDIGILLEMAQIYSEMEEYEKCLETVRKLVEEYQVFAAYASSMEAYRRQLNAGGVIRAANACLRHFPNFARAYEYLAKVYLDLNRREDLEQVLADAGKNGVRSAILEAYAFQMDHGAMDIRILDARLKNFREIFLRQVERGNPGSYEKGLPILTEYLYHYPDDFMLVERAIFHRVAHHLEEARADFEKALYLNPVNPYALNGLSFVYKYRGEYERALYFLKKAILYMDREMSPVIYADMGNLYALLGLYEKAVESYLRYESLAGEAKGSWFDGNLAEFYLRLGLAEAAELIYRRFFKKNKWGCYGKLVALYNRSGERRKARRILRRWARELHAVTAMRFLEGVLMPARPGKQEAGSLVEYDCGKAWVELLDGRVSAALGAFGRMVRHGLADAAMEGKLCDAVFACILCGDDRRGRQYAARLRDWLRQERAAGRAKYYNREKKHLQMEFLAAYYMEPPERLQTILDREGKCEICHSCSRPRCRGMEAVRILFLLRMGNRADAGELLLESLAVQPWDEFLLAINRVAFADS